MPTDWPVYGGSDPRDASDALRYVRVEFAGAAPAIGFHGAGEATVIEYVQVHASLGPGSAFSGHGLPATAAWPAADRNSRSGSRSRRRSDPRFPPKGRQSRA